MTKEKVKEKTIKPKPFEKIIKTYAPAAVWPNVPEEVRKQYSWHLVLRDWLCEIVPGGDLDKYCKVELIQSPDNEFNVAEIVATLYTRENRFLIIANEEKIFIEATRRKPLAGTEFGEETYEGDELYQGGFSVEEWQEAKNQIFRYEFVRVTKDHRTGLRWQTLNSHYSNAGGIEFYAEWEQRGDEIRNHRVYQMIGEKKVGVVEHT